MIALKDNLGTDFVERVHSIFAAAGLLSKATNFEFRPQQQAMAVQGVEELGRSGIGVGESGVSYSTGDLLAASSYLMARG